MMAGSTEDIGALPYEDTGTTPQVLGLYQVIVVGRLHRNENSGMSGG